MLKYKKHVLDLKSSLKNVVKHHPEQNSVGRLLFDNEKHICKKKKTCNSVWFRAFFFLFIFLHIYEIKILAPWKKSYDKPRQHIKKQRHYFTDKGLSGQSYGFSDSHV